MEAPIVIIVSAVIAIWLSAVFRALTELSGGRIRRLDSQKQKDLIDDAEDWLARRSLYRTVLRFVILINVAAIAAAVSHWIGASWGLAGARCWLVAAAVTGIGVVAATEIVAGNVVERHSMRLLGASMPVVTSLAVIASPIINPMHALRQSLDVGDEADEEEKVSVADEILSLVDQDTDEEEEGLEDVERRMIRGIMDLDETLVKEIMTPRVDLDSVPETASLSDVRKRIIASGHSRIPVYRENVDDIVGVIYSKHLLDEDRLKAISSLDSIWQAPIFIPETKHVSDLLEEFKQNQIHIAVVIDEYGGTAGVVTIEDILEEIVGEIRDEFDDDEKDPLRTVHHDGSVLVDGRTPIGEINEMLDVSISEEEEYDTIGGYVTAELGRIPRVSENVAVGDLECRILEADERKITKLQLSRIDAEVARQAG
jgi:CBS domain containing-hemolysin-like protein